MRALPLAVAGLLALTAAVAPLAVAGVDYVPPPICLICIIITQIVIPCAVAEVNQDVFDNGDGCVIVNSVQHALDCDVRGVEATIGLGQPCTA
jgi:hypothetical protein